MANTMFKTARRTLPADFSGRYDFMAVDVPRKAPLMKLPDTDNPTPEQLARRQRTAEVQELKSDADAVLVKLSYTEWSSLGLLRQALKAGKIVLTHERLDQVLDYLISKSRIAADGASWKRV